jgi:hypothetical protein
VVGVGGTEDESEQPASGQLPGRWRRRARATSGAAGTGGRAATLASAAGRHTRAAAGRHTPAMAESSARQRGKREMKRRAGPAGVKKLYVRRLPARPSDINLFPRASREKPSDISFISESQQRPSDIS